MKQFIARAGADTLAHFTTLGGIAGLIGFPVFVLAARFYDRGRQHIMDAIWDEFWAVAVALPVWLLLVFAFNLACAPYRIVRDRLLEAEHELINAKNRLAGFEVSEKTSARTLSPEQKASLSRILREAAGHLAVLHVVYAPSGEPADFAAEISDAILTAGLQSLVHHGTFYAHDPRARGVRLIYLGPLSKQLAQMLSTELQSFGFETEAILDRDRDVEEALHIYVART